MAAINPAGVSKECLVNATPQQFLYLPTGGGLGWAGLKQMGAGWVSRLSGGGGTGKKCPEMAVWSKPHNKNLPGLWPGEAGQALMTG